MNARSPIPAGTPMPTPVPPGRFAEYAAAISEGFCPACRVSLDPWPPMPSGPRGDCQRCGANWFLSISVPPGIQWRNTIPASGTADGMTWDIWSNDLDHVRGSAAWAE